MTGRQVQALVLALVVLAVLVAAVLYLRKRGAVPSPAVEA